MRGLLFGEINQACRSAQMLQRQRRAPFLCSRFCVYDTFRTRKQDLFASQRTEFPFQYFRCEFALNEKKAVYLYIYRWGKQEVAEGRKRAYSSNPLARFNQYPSTDALHNTDCNEHFQMTQNAHILQVYGAVSSCSVFPWKLKWYAM
jgi:hypothetical protein